MAHILREDVYKILDELPKERFLGDNRDLIYLEEARAEIERLPTADVLPKSEVDRLNAVMKEMDEQRAYTINMLGESLEKAKSEVAREIFEELENVLKIVVIPCVNEDGCITPLRASYWSIDPNDYAELKKKYTEEQS